MKQRLFSRNFKAQRTLYPKGYVPHVVSEASSLWNIAASRNRAPWLLVQVLVTTRSFISDSLYHLLKWYAKLRSDLSRRSKLVLFIFHSVSACVRMCNHVSERAPERVKLIFPKFLSRKKHFVQRVFHQRPYNNRAPIRPPKSSPLSICSTLPSHYNCALSSRSRIATVLNSRLMMSFVISPSLSSVAGQANCAFNLTTLLWRRGSATTLKDFRLQPDNLRPV